VQGDAVDCMVALPGQLFYGTQIPACLWILAKDKSNGVAMNEKLRDRRGEVLFIDARKMGTLVPGSRKQKELSEDEIRRVAATYHAWRGEACEGAYEDLPGFCKSATLESFTFWRKRIRRWRDSSGIRERRWFRQGCRYDAMCPRRFASGPSASNA
jgi:type I restriction-modification system DNA methylase subunit